MTRQGRQVVVGSMLALTTGSTAISFYTQSLFLGPMTHDLGWTAVQYFEALLIAGIAAAAATPLVGLLVDRFGVRVVAITGIVMFALSNVLLGMVGRMLLPYFAASAFSATMGIAHGPLAYSKAVASWFDRRRGLALAIALSGSGIGGILIPPLTAWLIHDYGWRAARLGLAAVVLVVALPAAVLFVRENHAPTRAIDRGRQTLSGDELAPLRRWLADPTLWLLAIAFLLSSAVVNGVLANLVPLQTGKGLAINIATASLSGLAFAQVGGRFLSGALLDRVQSARIGLVWYAAAAAGVLCLWKGSSPTSAIAGSMLVGVALGSELEMASIFVSRFFGLGHFGKLYGIVFGAYIAGAAIGPLLFSIVARGTKVYNAALGASLIALTMASLLLLLTGRYRFLPLVNEVVQ